MEIAVLVAIAAVALGVKLQFSPKNNQQDRVTEVGKAYFEK